MSGETEVKKLLVKLGISTTDATLAVKELLALFAQADKQAATAAVEQQRQQKISIGDAKVELSQRQLIAQEIRNQTALEQKRMAVAQAETAELQKQLALLKLQTAESQKNTSSRVGASSGPIPISNYSSARMSVADSLAARTNAANELYGRGSSYKQWYAQNVVPEVAAITAETTTEIKQVTTQVDSFATRINESFRRMFLSPIQWLKELKTELGGKTIGGYKEGSFTPISYFKDAGGTTRVSPTEEFDELGAAVGKTTKGLRQGQAAATSLFSVIRGNGLRAVARFIGMSETLGPIIAKAFNVFAVLGFIELLTQLPAMFSRLEGAITGWDEKAKKAYDDLVTENQQATKAVRDLQFAQIDMQKIGAKGQKALDLENTTIQQKIKLLQQAQVEAKNAAIGAVQELDLREAYNKSGAANPGNPLAGVVMGLVDPLGIGGQSKAELEKTRDEKEKEARELDAEIRKLQLEDAARTAKEVAAKEREMARELAKEKLELNKQLADETYQAQITGIHEESANLERAYKNRELSFAAYIERKRASNKQETDLELHRQATLNEISKKELDLDKEDLGKKYNVKIDELKSKTAAAYGKITAEDRVKQSALDQQVTDDRLAADKEAISGVADLQEAASAQKRTVVERAYKDELISAENYYDTLKQLNREDAQSKTEAENEKYKLETSSAENDIRHALELVKIKQTAANQEINLEEEKLNAIDEKRGIMFDRQRARFDKEVELYRTASVEQTKPGGVFSSMLGRFSRTGGVAQGLQIGMSGLGAVQNFQGGRNAGDVASPLREGFKYLFQDRTKLDQQGVEALKNFNSALQAGAEAVTSFLQALTQPRSAAAGGFAGGFATMGLSKTLAGAFPNQLGALGGPIGQAASLIIGGTIGALFGHIRAELERTATKLNEAFRNTTRSIDDGGVRLTEGIKQLQAIRQNAIDSFSGSKMGRQKLKEILPQMEDQIHALNNQLAKTVNDFNLAYGKLLKPEGMGAFIDSLDGILKQYKEFASAIDDTAKAQDYLNRSVQQYIDSQQRELNQTEMDAIQNALDYNNLLKERKDLVDQWNTAQYDALTSGNLSRQRTAAQQALAEQAKQARAYQDQLHQIDQQIALAKFKTEQEQHVFNLAATRVGLEAQLLEMQKAQTTYDLQRVRALQELVTLFQNGSSTAINSFLNAAGLAPDLRSLFENAFNQYGRYGFTNVQTQ